ncbi:hypothetical protein J3E64_002796 [Sphingobium sp. OAS761]|nr:hypothetical protein [Sphingobium sp. OAS761]
MGVYAQTFFILKMDRPELSHVRDWYVRQFQKPAHARSIMILLT